MRLRPHLVRLTGLLAASACAGTPERAHGALMQDQVLVVYDSRIAGSLEVAEHYAGSAKVPGGLGNVAGARPGVRVLDLASVTPSPCGSPPCAAVPDVDYATFQARYRLPLRNYLVTSDLSRRVRVIVLTKGLSHRILDTDNAVVGDNGAAAGAEFNAADATYASVDAELTLLMTDLSVGEAGGAGDSRADGMIVNPYARARLPVNSWRTRNIAQTKAINVDNGAGQIWRGATSPGLTTSVLPGDMYMVCRLDGHSVAQVKAAIDRAQNIVLDDEASAFLLDEGGGNGMQSADFAGDNEFDNDGPGSTNNGDDYEQARDFLAGDGRWLSSNIVYDFLPNPTNFLVGPLMNFGGGIIVSTPIAHLGTLGQNHNGGEPGSAGGDYAMSFTYAPGAVFNTIESYNGRAFGGLGTNAGQEQLADFLAAGGTLGIGNVWEPFSLTVGDNVLIAQNFWMGELTWAEAAYSAMPAISWQQIVVGDPLARAERKREDINGDGVVDIHDLYAWHESASPRDVNRSGTADAADARLIERAIRGTDVVDMNLSPAGEQID